MYRAELDKINQANNNWKKIDHHSFLIIGATGMIGSYMIDVLMRRNEKNQSNIHIYAMGRSIDRLKKRFSMYEESTFFHMVEADVTQPFMLDKEVDYIFHGASNTHPRAYATDPIGTIMTNLMGTQQVLEFAVKKKAQRVAFLSTVEIYGENRGDVEKFTEDYCGYIDCNTLRAGYPEGKRAGESLCQAYIAKHDLDIIIPRVCRTFGPTMLLNDSKASSQFILNAVNNEDIVLKSEGNQYFSYAYVGDVVYALLYLLGNGENGEAYNIAVPEFDLHLKDLAHGLAALNQKEVIFDLPDEEERRGFSTASQAILASDKIDSIGWRPLFGLNEALKNTVELIRNERI
ncbi:NAD-dependent epimerase/dehydratase family protein [Enterococcus dongliensis]|nr:NAD-dependent epimerase/dehydratase family protein [Enterococcus dongliensis]MDT2633455.1 NAD-dependent epimerase/dehydratase family protein [Enterococcus dongliensis]MDT2641323.1 NAD-dependent epimerase/dehydratase family protein [Enterococcus dongliensis]MDT2646543.1 NAD-dependent epimerase/dehydratase family protein [Enterococcus dongliensis]MDT2710540.1 NAD-dependent epimerase/dehydratase family protein [Enterococcus dongliensis]